MECRKSLGCGALLAAGLVSFSCAGERGSIGFASGRTNGRIADPIVETNVSVYYCKSNPVKPKAILCTKAVGRTYTDSIMEQKDECPPSASDILCEHKLIGADLESKGNSDIVSFLRRKASTAYASVLSETASRDCSDPSALASVRTVMTDYSLVKRSDGDLLLSKKEKVLDEKHETFSVPAFCKGFGGKQQ